MKFWETLPPSWDRYYRYSPYSLGKLAYKPTALLVKGMRSAELYLFTLMFRSAENAEHHQKLS